LAGLLEISVATPCNGDARRRRLRHWTNAPESIGGFVFYGDIRMYNADITNLFARASTGTRVIVLK